jgi:hypothetical protein
MKVILKLLQFFLLTLILLFSNCILSIISIPGCLKSIDNIKSKDADYLKAEKTAIMFFKAISDSNFIKAYELTKKDSSFERFQDYSSFTRCYLKTSKSPKFHAYRTEYYEADSPGTDNVRHDYFCFFYSYKSKCGSQGSNYYSTIKAIGIPRGDSLIDNLEFHLSFCCP